MKPFTACSIRASVLIGALLAGACTAAPAETVELTEIIDQQIAQMQVSHESFVKLYYDGLRADVDEFMEKRWTPEFLSTILSGQGQEGAKFRADLDKAYKREKIDWNQVVSIDRVEDTETRVAVQDALRRLAVQEKAAFGQVLLDFSAAAQEQIDERRRTLMGAVDTQEAQVLARLRESYADLQRGTSAVRGYLASVVAIAQERDAILEKAGLLDEQRALVQKAMQASELASSALTKVDSADGAIGSFLDALGVDSSKGKAVDGTNDDSGVDLSALGDDSDDNTNE